MDDRKLIVKDAFKVVRAVLEVIVVVAVIFWVVWSLVSHRERQRVMLNEAELECAMVSSDEIVAGFQPVVSASGPHFIAISYNGLTDVEREGGKIVTQASYEEQMQSLKASGYQTITQQDVINFYNSGASLPEKALLLIFEDGILNTTRLAQPSLWKYNYIATACTFAENLSDEGGYYINAREMNSLMHTTFWEIGSNGYRLSYINVFDRFDNYFGHLNTPEFLDIHTFLRRDYNHYLMDFLRDENRLRTESVAEMEERIEWDYKKMDEIYKEETGTVPPLYILMHSNTGAFGNDPQVSRKNAEMIENIFAMNFNRQGTCLNMRDSSIYDLSRLQSRQYFSPNHLMMRIWDDTGHQVVFRLGDPEKAADWERQMGAAEFKNRKIVLTSMPYGESRICLLRDLPRDLDLSVRLQGNLVGRQSILLRADQNGEKALSVSLHDGALLIEEGDKEEPLFKLDLIVFDGGPFVSKAEEERDGKIALAETVIANDHDEARIDEAKHELERLRAMQVPGIADGGEPFIPELDIDEQDDRSLRIRLVGNLLTVWLDGEPVAEDLRVSSNAGGNLFLAAAVTQGTERFSQTNLSDDVYDGIFAELTIRDSAENELYAYAPPLPVIEEDSVDSFLDRISSLFSWANLHREGETQ